MFGRLSEAKKQMLHSAEAVKAKAYAKYDGNDDEVNQGTFCIVAIFKNEGEVLNEWIRHYLAEGCSKFFMIDNGSNDNYVVDEIYQDKVDIVIDDTKHAQAKLYNQHFFATKKVHGYNWTMIVDLDEFVYSRRTYKTIKEYLKSVSDPTVAQIAIPWKVFGSNGYDTPEQKEPPSCIQGFTKRIDYDKDPEVDPSVGFQGVKETVADMKLDLVKCVARSSAIKSLGIHTNELKYGYTCQSHDHTDPVETLPFAPVNESRFKFSSLHLNHYASTLYIR